MEIVKLIGSDVLPDDQKLIIEIARVIRVGLPAAECVPSGGYLCAAWKSRREMMQVILHLYQQGSASSFLRAVPISGILQTGLFDKLVKMKYDIPNNRLDMFDEYIGWEIDDELPGRSRGSITILQGGD